MKKTIIIADKSCKVCNGRGVHVIDGMWLVACGCIISKIEIRNKDGMRTLLSKFPNGVRLGGCV